MRLLLKGMGVFAGCYLIGAFAAYLLLAQFSSNTHDRMVEAAMSAALIFGPAFAVIGTVAMLVGSRLSARTLTRKSPS